MKDARVFRSHIRQKMRREFWRRHNYHRFFANHRALILTCLLFFMAEVLLQWRGGAFSSEFGGYPDEAGHYITGLMVRDYISGFQPSSPMRFAENYYLHYPKVALGHWPPFFYVVQAAWTLLFSPSRVSIILLMAILATLLSCVVYMTIRREFGTKAGIAVGLLLIALPLIQTYSKMVMAEILVALLSFCAVVCFGRFLDTGRWQHSVAFGIWASLAILTKGNGLALALIPLLALLFSRRFHLLARPCFWYPAVIVLASCGPFYWLTLDMVRNGWQYGAPNLEFTIAGIGYYSRQLTQITGFGLSLFIALGFFMRVIKPWRHGRVEGKWAAIGALPLSVWAFQCLIPSGLEARHLITAAPALLMFLVAGIAAAAGGLPLHRLSYGQRLGLLASAAAMLFVLEAFSIPRKSCHGFAEVAQRLLAAPAFRNSLFLVSSDPKGEGMFISEVAMREKRPGHAILRASKVLGTSRWDGSDYEVLHRTPEELMTYLKEIPVEIVVLDLSVSEPYHAKHHRLLKEMIEAYPGLWKLLGTYPLVLGETEHPDALRVYRQVGQMGQHSGTIRVDMRKMLGKILEYRIDK